MIVYFSRSTSPLSRIIQYFTGGKWSHNAIKMNGGKIIDSRFPGGVQLRDFDLKDYEAVEIEGDETKALKYIGAKYDIIHFLWYGFKWGDSIWNNPYQFICSEIIAECAYDNNYENKNPNEQYKYFKESEQD